MSTDRINKKLTAKYRKQMTPKQQKSMEWLEYNLGELFLVDVHYAVEQCAGIDVHYFSLETTGMDEGEIDSDRSFIQYSFDAFMAVAARLETLIKGCMDSGMRYFAEVIIWFESAWYESAETDLVFNELDKIYKYHGFNSLKDEVDAKRAEFYENDHYCKVH